MLSISHSDSTVIWSCTNDYELYGVSLPLQNITDFIMSNKHMNSSIFILNRKIKKLVKAFPHTSFLDIDNNSNLLTDLGLHRKKLGKSLVTYQIVSFLQLFFEQKSSVPIFLGWHSETHDDNNTSLNEGNKVKVPTRNES
jgi:hypothetical protein